MASTLQYILTDYWNEPLVGDPRSLHLPMMSSLGPLLALITGYVLLVIWIGPWLMQDRKPFELRRVIIVYNLANIVFNLYFFCYILVGFDYGRKLFDFRRRYNDDHSPETYRNITHIWLYLLTKLFDLIETVFFVMRKKQSQVSFLHVYHHSVVPILVWVGLRCAPTFGPAGMFPLLNTVIHVVMYTYYLLAALGPQYQRYLFWKKYITTIQLAQFVIFTVYAVLGLIMNQEGDYPMGPVLMGFAQAPLFFVMFYRFYQASYVKPKRN